MKKSLSLFTVLGGIFLCLQACTTVPVEAPVVEAPKANRLQTAKKTLKNKKQATAEIPPVLGGIVQSNSWVIYKDKEQEEFKGNVSYDNGFYVFKAAYALSDRAHQTFTAKGNVYLKQTEKHGSSYEAYADEARYNYKTQKGTLTTYKNKQIKLNYLPLNEPSVTAMADKGTFDLNTRIFTLEGNVLISRPTPQGVQTMRAQKALVKQLEDFVRLDGNAQISDEARTLEAETIIYDGQHNQSYAYGARPLVSGKTDDGSFAIIADRVSSDAEGNSIVLDGQVQGWVISDELNSIDTDKFNKGFSYGTKK